MAIIWLVFLDLWRVSFCSGKFQASMSCCEGAEENIELEFTWTVLIFKGLSCGLSEIVVLAFTVFKRTIFIISARNQDPPRDNGAKHKDSRVCSLLHIHTWWPLPFYSTYSTHIHRAEPSFMVFDTSFYWGMKCNMFSQISAAKILVGAQQSYVWNMTQQFQAKVSKLNSMTFHNHRSTLYIYS